MWAVVAILVVAIIIMISQMPQQEDAKPVGLDRFTFPTASATRAIPWGFGRYEVKGANVVDYWGLYTEEIITTIDGGAFGGDQDLVTGFEYYLEGVVFVLGWSTGGMQIKGVKFGDYTAWTGDQDIEGTFEIDRRFLFDDDEGVAGDVVFKAGGSSQTAFTEWRAEWSEAPAGKDVAMVMFKNFYFGNSSNIKAIAFEVANYPNPFNHATHHEVGDDANGAYALWEIWTNPRFGAGRSTADFDQASFEAAAETLYNEGLGVSMIFDSTQSADAMEQEILKHITASFYTDQTTGKRKLELIRPDYLDDSPPLSSLPTINEDNIVSLKNFKRGSLTSIATEVRVKYIDRAGKYQERISHAQNTGSALDLGRDASVELSYTGFTTITNAEKKADSERNALTLSMASWNMIVDRTAWDWYSGKAFLLSYSPLGITQIVGRVLEIDKGTLESGKITMKCVEDNFGFGAAIFDNDVSAHVPVLINEPADITAPYLMELPNWYLTEFEIAAHRLLAFATRPTTDAISFDAWIDIDGTYEDAGQSRPFASTHAIDSSVDQFATTIDLTGEIVNLEDATTGEIRNGLNLMLVRAAGGDEIIGFTTVGYDSPPTKTILSGVVRGLMDTTPQDLAAGAVVFDMASLPAVSGAYANADDIDVKLLTKTFKGVLEIASATANNIVIDNRANRPLSVGRLEVNSSLHSAPADLSGDSLIEWKARDKDAAQLPFTTDTGITSEAGVSYHLRFVNPDTSPATVLRTVDNGTTESYTYAYADEISDNGDALLGNLQIEVWTQRDSPAVASYQKNVRTVRRALGFTDNFDRANEVPLGGIWYAGYGTGMDLTGNKIWYGATGTENISAIVNNSDTEDLTVETQVRVLGGANYGIGAVARLNGTRCYMLGVRNDGSVLLQAWVMGVSNNTLETTAASVFTALDTLKLEVSGSGASIIIKGYVNGVEEISHAPSASFQYDEGDFGLGHIQSAGKVDDFVVAEL